LWLNVFIQVDGSESKNEGKDDQIANLESNPTHPYEQAAKEATSKRPVEFPLSKEGEMGQR